MMRLVKMRRIKDSIRVLISLALILVFYFMFGVQIMERFKANDVGNTKNEEETSIIPSPCTN